METIDVEQTGRTLLAAGERLLPFVTDTVAVLHREIQSGKSLLFEGAQGTFLDIDQGTYPFVTSSNTIAAGACTGSGVGPGRIDRVVGVAKAYTTRVGSGPFPTEHQPLSDRFHAMGREFGATTGRKRRCGWLDLVLLRYAAIVNGIDSWAITNLDGLDGLDEIPVCTHYLIDGEKTELPPASIAEFDKAVPVFETLPGWKTDTTSCRQFENLPPLAKAYLDRLEKETGSPIGAIGVGPERCQTILR